MEFFKKNRKYFYTVLVFLLIAVFVLIFSLLSFGRHDSLKSYLNDLGAYDQVVWNTAHGHFFEITTSMFGEKKFFAGHFSPILILFVPFYLIFASPKWLLFFQALAVGLSAIPIFYLAREKLKSQALGLVFLISYLLYPVLHNGLLYDFHEVVFATVFASWAFYFLEKGKDRWFIFFAVLLALSQEHLPLLVFMMGIYLFFVKKRRRFGLAVSFFSLFYFLSVIFVLMPFFSSSENLALLQNNSTYPSRYAWLGSSPGEIIRKIITDPLSIAAALVSPERIKYLFLLVMPVFSLAIFAWPILIILPLILINILSSNSMTFNISFYHSAIFAPFVYFSSIVVFKKWLLGIRKIKIAFAALLLAFSFICAVMFGLTPLSNHYSLNDFTPSDHSKKISEIKKILPTDAELSVQHNLGPHFTERQKVYRFPVKADEAKYVLLDRTDPFGDIPRQAFSFVYALQMDLAEWEGDIEMLEKSDSHELIYNSDGYLLFRRL
jgi:uncharacterized membrane protein